MKPGLTLHLRDLSPALVAAWREAFAGEPGVLISHGDIFSERAGPVTEADPIDVRADAVVSPANSFGFMDGGIDAVYTWVFGPGVQDALRARLARDFAGELPVGQAVIVPTGRPEIPWCISAPTMRVPSDVSETSNAYLALRAALLAVQAHNLTDAHPIRSLLCPGLATAVGAMPPDRCARQMLAAWRRIAAGEAFAPHTLRAAVQDEVELRR